MSPTRLAILLLILVGITLFALQNWSPVLPLVILGTQTQALPLAIWMVGAIAAGAITTLIVSVLFKFSSFTVSPRRSKPKKVGRVASDPRTPWGSSQQSASQQSAFQQSASQQDNEPMDVPFMVTDSVPDYVYAASNAAGSASNVTNDDWEQSSSRTEEWEDWEDSQELVQPVDRPTAQTTSFSNTQTFIQDQPTDSNSYPSGFSHDKEEWEDWEDYQESEEDEFEDEFEENAEPSRTIYEVQQTPKSTYRSGSIYSYSYRDASDSSAGETESVDHADYRVIIPPYQPDSEPTAEAMIDDFAQDDPNQDDPNWADRPKSPGNKPSDDEDW